MSVCIFVTVSFCYDIKCSLIFDWIIDHFSILYRIPHCPFYWSFKNKYHYSATAAIRIGHFIVHILTSQAYHCSLGYNHSRFRGTLCKVKLIFTFLLFKILLIYCCEFSDKKKPEKYLEEGMIVKNVCNDYPCGKCSHPSIVLCVWLSYIIFPVESWIPLTFSLLLLALFPLFVFSFENRILWIYSFD